MRNVFGGIGRSIGAFAFVGLAAVAAAAGVVTTAWPAGADPATDYELSKLIVDQPIADAREMIGGDPQLSSGHLALDYWLGLDAKDRSLAALVKHVTGAYQRVWETADARRLFIWAIEFDSAARARSYVTSFNAGGDHHSPFTVDGIDGADASFGDKDGIVLEQVGFTLDARAFTVILAGDKRGDHVTVADVARHQSSRAQRGPALDTTPTVATVPPVGRTSGAEGASAEGGASGGQGATVTTAPLATGTSHRQKLLREAVGGAVIVAVFIVVVRIGRRRKHAQARRHAEQMAELPRATDGAGTTTVAATGADVAHRGASPVGPKRGSTATRR